MKVTVKTLEENLHHLDLRAYENMNVMMDLITSRLVTCSDSSDNVYLPKNEACSEQIEMRSDQKKTSIKNLNGYWKRLQREESQGA